MRYPVKLMEDGNEFVVSFPDIPEALTSGRTKQEALEMARDALITALDFYFEDNRAVPEPSAVEAGQDFVELPASLWAKVLLLNEIVAQRLRPIDLARRLEMRPQEITRLLKLEHPTKIDTLTQAFGALGKRLNFSVSN